MVAGSFLRDVASLAVTAFGGPNVHITLMLEQLVRKRKYVTEEELIELMGLCQLLPGPTSTQTITAVGYKLGGARLAFLTLLIWISPAVLLMTLLALLWHSLSGYSWWSPLIQFIPALAVGFITHAAWTIGRKVATTRLTFFILLASATLAVVVSAPWIFPVVILAGGLATMWSTAGTSSQPTTAGSIRWTYLLAYAGLFAASGLVAIAFHYPPAMLFEQFYRYGSLVFGGGQVLIPMMLEQFTHHSGWVSEQVFLTGYGVVQATPGPVFSFCAFLGAMAMQEDGSAAMLVGSLIGTAGIFLPGTLLIFFVYPMWEWLKQFEVIRRALKGINAAAGGLVAAAVLMMIEANGWWQMPTHDLAVPVMIAVAIFLLLRFTRIPAPLLVVATMAAGLLLQ